MLGVGPDGHVASLFPEHPAVHEEERSVVAVHGAPKPPPTRLSLTFPALNAAREVWFLVSGEEKAGAYASPWVGPDRCRSPRRAYAAGSAPCGCWTVLPRRNSRSS